MKLIKRATMQMVNQRLTKVPEVYQRNPAAREEGAWNGNGFKNIYATTNSTASSEINDENRCAEIHLFASLFLKQKEQMQAS